MPSTSPKKPKLEAVVDDEKDVELPPSVQASEETKPDVAPETVAISFRGINFTIPKEMDEWETEACLAMSQNEYVLAAKTLLGPAQWMHLQSLGSKRKDIREFLSIFADTINAECVG